MEHGLTAYVRDGCRCDVCRDARRASNERAKANRRARAAELAAAEPVVVVEDFAADDVLPLLDAPSSGLAGGLCAEVDPELFFPDEGHSPKLAMKVCGRCDVRTRCLQWALETDQRFGVWGGVSMHDRVTVDALKAG